MTLQPIIKIMRVTGNNINYIYSFKKHDKINLNICHLIKLYIYIYINNLFIIIIFVIIIIKLF